LFFAVMAGDVQTAGLLLDAGARLGDRMKILGVYAARPLVFAAFVGDSPMAEYLINEGADPNDAEDDGISALQWATLANHADMVDMLIKAGAQLNHLDNRNMTPLLYAASIDFGDTTVLERLIAAGADLEVRNKQGLTALDLANDYHHRALAKLL